MQGCCKERCDLYFYTFISVPGMVGHVLNTLSQNVIKISWSEPSARNGVIIGYTVTISSPDYRNIVKFKCIGCPDTNVCVPPVFVTVCINIKDNSLYILYWCLCM